MTIINIRGSNGSGKSTLVRQVMQHLGKAAELVEPGTDSVWGYELNQNIYVLGKYTTACGGVDTIHDFASTKKGVRILAKLGNVLFEGVLWSTVFKSSDELVRELPQHHIIFGMLDTPGDVCVKRVLQRRREASNEKPFNPDKLLGKVETIRRCQDRLKQAGYDTRTIPHENALETVMGWLEQHGGGVGSGAWEGTKNEKHM